MAKHTFVTASHTTWDETKIVEILTRADVKKVVLGVIDRATEDLTDKIKVQERKLAKVSEQVAATAMDAATAREEVKRLVETARETFRDVIAELLEPHYRLLAQHLGIELPVETAKQKATEKKHPASSRSTPPPSSAGGPLSKGAGKKRQGTVSKTSKKRTTTKKTATVRRQETKGFKPCRKK